MPGVNALAAGDGPDAGGIWKDGGGGWGKLWCWE